MTRRLSKELPGTLHVSLGPPGQQLRTFYVIVSTDRTNMVLLVWDGRLVEVGLGAARRSR